MSLTDNFDIRVTACLWSPECTESTPGCFSPGIPSCGRSSGCSYWAPCWTLPSRPQTWRSPGPSWPAGQPGRGLCDWPGCRGWRRPAVCPSWQQGFNFREKLDFNTFSNRSQGLFKSSKNLSSCWNFFGKTPSFSIAGWFLSWRSQRTTPTTWSWWLSRSLGRFTVTIKTG